VTEDTAPEKTPEEHVEDLKGKIALAVASTVGPKAGAKSTEFWLTLLVNAVGVALLAYGAAKGNDTLAAVGGVLIAVAQGTYTLGRSGVKKAAALVLVFVMLGCGTPGYVKASAIEPTVTRIIHRHNAYVQADPAISDLERGASLRDGELILKVLAEAQKPTE
jgi:hypothetical protein